ncbi:MAG: pbpE [Sporomusa sp.]|jgi:CubicO group peptidase (beta-lactamase class C family)|nr:pbpE [Sporomusa sp.]
MNDVTATERVALCVLNKWFCFCATHLAIPGLQICIRRKGRIIFSQAYGFASLKGKNPYTTESLGHLASHSKMLAACVTLQLQQDGVLNILDPLTKYLPWLLQHNDERFREVTIRDLLTHRSGLFSNGSDGCYWALERPFPGEEELIAEVLQTNLVYAPNTETKYSNIGFALLGLVLQAAAGLSYKELVHKLTLDKLQKQSFLVDYVAGNTQFADGHSKKLYSGQRKIFRHVPANAMAPATGLCGNAEGASLFLHAMCFGDELLPLGIRRDLLSLKWPVKNVADSSYGLGLAFKTFRGKTYVGHSGSYPGFSSQTHAWVGTDYVISVVVNASEPIDFSILRSVANIIGTIRDAYPAEDLQRVLVSDPMVNWWGGGIYVVGENKALYFPINGWLLGDDAVQLERRKDGAYESQKMSGYSSVGEPVRFDIEREQIIRVKFGSFTIFPEKIFLEKSKAAFI